MTRLTICALALVGSLAGQTAPKAAASKPAAAKPPAAAKAKPARKSPEDALRARASQFLQYHVEGDFWKAMELVADATKKDYFAAGKQKLKSFTIDSIKLTDNNTKAVVNATVKRDWQIRMQEHEVVVPMVTNWRIEKGQWVWYWDVKDAWLTPMGESKIEPPARNADGTIKLPPNFSPEVIAAAAKSILGQSSVDKSEVSLDSSKASEAVVYFTNGVQGTIRAALVGVPQVPGLTATLESNDVASGQKVAVKIRFEPAAEAPVPEAFTMQVVTEPVNQGYPIRVKFSAPTP